VCGACGYVYGVCVRVRTCMVCSVHVSQCACGVCVCTCVVCVRVCGVVCARVCEGGMTGITLVYYIGRPRYYKPIPGKWGVALYGVSLPEERRTRDRGFDPVSGLIYLGPSRFRTGNCSAHLQGYARILCRTLFWYSSSAPSFRVK
jgi:hypothetical protein